ncbi:hypothetical protein J5226_19790 [Lysobacter sp. K5869]|uniref:hypothetical protein n=1 Tax=Lysobacter sp. K5869 TaxID=2820808 RepID=UPI001C06252D|nr:hypothetical protein [Lysobacter sp. K5869]QWP75828.1 hypothetical protein J5226_19790 [Lysobacter sp. K5869]
MSHPVFLESPPWPRMPEGGRGEWPGYFAQGGPSLEANARIPLFWQALFAPDDLQQARSLDEFDPDSEAVELAEFREGATRAQLEATYPYLVAERDAALTRLLARRDALLGLVGERYRPIFDAFADYVRNAYGPYLLVRTGGLPDAEDATGWLSAQLQCLVALERSGEASAPLADDADELARAHDRDAVWLATGSGGGSDDPALAWPSLALRKAWPACVPLPRSSRPANDDAGDRPRYRPPSRLDNILEWLAALIFAAAALGTWFATRSLWLSALAAAVATVVTVWGLLWLKRER